MDDRVFRASGCWSARVVGETWRARFLVLGSCWRWMLTASWCRIAGSDLGGPGCLVCMRAGRDQRQPLCDELGGYPEMRVRAWEATRRAQLSWTGGEPNLALSVVEARDATRPVMH